jgi:hypothetical protein
MGQKLKEANARNSSDESSDELSNGGVPHKRRRPAVTRKHISGLARAFDAARGAGHASHRRFNAAFAKELTRELGAATARRLLAELARLGKSRTGKTPRGLLLDK